ncbi:hypothetical protein FANTH_7200 [Fusarium anthophilum]|uniref:Uncharacterized protein n=1 Tax=Fusarium anthophilum TaxID=48485 RepID=A0A8H4ZGM0_9HYPO|nr:hypothetical protein FANTH_7200 [Fusarium anthophilum]
MSSKWAVLFLPLLSSGIEIVPRRDGEDHGDSGTGHNHSMAHGQFNFTPSGIPWPTCARTYCNANFDHFPKPGVYAVVAEIECPKDEGYEVDIDKEAVVADLKDAGGTPQSCEGINETIQCQNGTSENAEVNIVEEVRLVFSAATIASLVAFMAWGL